MKKFNVNVRPQPTTSANFYMILGWLIIILGFVAGCFLGNVTTYETVGTFSTYVRETTEFSFIVASYYWVGGFLLGVLFVAIGSIVDLLREIANKSYVIEEVEETTEETTEENKTE